MDKDFKLSDVKKITTLYDEDDVNNFLRKGWVLLNILQENDEFRDYGTMVQISKVVYIVGHTNPSDIRT